MADRGRGRASRGRARGSSAQGGAPQSRPGPPTGQAQQEPQGGRPGPPQPPGGVWAGRATAVLQAAQAAPPNRAPAPEVVQSAGRGSRPRPGEDRSGVTADPQQVIQGKGDGHRDKAGNGHRGGPSGAGVRGRTNRNEILNTRPAHVVTKKGTDGVPICLKANYFQLLSATQWGLNQYRVDFSVDLDDTKIRKRLLGIGIRQYNLTGYLFDGTVLYTPNRLHPDPCEFVVQNEATGENVTVNIRMVGEVAAGDYHYLQLFNIIIKKCFAYMNFQLIGRNYFDPKMKIEIPEHNIEIMPGVLTSMRQFESNIMLVADLSFKMLRIDSVYDILMECANSRNPRQEFQQRVIGSIVMTSYNNKTYRVDDVDFTQKPDSTFQRRDGTQVTYKRYFEERYHLKVTRPDQPLLVSRTKPREIRAGMPEIVVLVPELCIMTGLTDRQRENFQLMKALAEHTRISAGERIQKLMQFAERLHACPEAIEEVRKWDLQLATNLVEFSGRVLPPENLYLRLNQVINGGEEADWTRNLRVAPMFNTVHVEKLAVIVPNRFAQSARDFSGMLTKVGDKMSMTIKSRVFEMPDDRAQTYISQLEQVITNLSPSMVMVVLPNNSGDRYNTVKKKCYIDRAMPCQVMVGRNLSSKGAMSIATKVAIQMNCKMGGAPWGTSLPAKTMVCGYDVCRDTANKSKSFAGMVASMDRACTRYYSMAVEHEQEQELSTNIAAFMIMACQKYQELNNTLPERIIVYRDGVGDGQIPYVREHEVDLIKEKLKKELYNNAPVKMAFIIVSKRINTKIFRSQPNQCNDFNPPPGTVVDDVITWPERYDFYIVSQCVRQGTVSPTSYNVIEDTLGIDANKIQRFTYKMCHMYFNWSGTVRVPAPCQYAHKLAFLTAQSLHRPANPQLAHSLYYL